MYNLNELEAVRIAHNPVAGQSMERVKVRKRGAGEEIVTEYASLQDFIDDHATGMQGLLSVTDDLEEIAMAIVGHWRKVIRGFAPKEATVLNMLRVLKSLEGGDGGTE